jgi:hypothetical protein
MRALKAARTQARVACPAPRGSHREGRPTSPRHGTVRGYCWASVASAYCCCEARLPLHHRRWYLPLAAHAAGHSRGRTADHGQGGPHEGARRPAAWAWAVALELWMGREQSSALRRRLGCMSAQLSPAAGGGGPLTALEGTARAEDDGTYGEQEGFPAWGSLADLHLDHIAMSNETRGCPVVAKHRVGNFVNVPGQGFESVFPHNTIRADPTTSAPLAAALKPDFSYEYNGQRRTPADYLDTWPVTGLFIGRGDEIWLEEYRYARDGDMRFTSWSMAKSVTSLLLGVAVDRGLISSLDDTPDMYVPELKGSYHGAVTLRNLCNMSSGAKHAYLLRCRFIQKMIISPRQARDKHSENSPRDTFSQELMWCTGETTLQSTRERTGAPARTSQRPLQAGTRVKKRQFAPFILKLILLPRQARDKTHPFTKTGSGQT